MQRWLQRLPFFYLLLSAVLFVRSYLLAEGMLLGLACVKLAAAHKRRLLLPFLGWLLAGAFSAAFSAEPLVSGHHWSGYLSGGLALMVGVAAAQKLAISVDGLRVATGVLWLTVAVGVLLRLIPALLPVASDPALQRFMPILTGWQQTLVLSWLLLWALSKSGGETSASYLSGIAACSVLIGFGGGWLGLGAVVGLLALAGQNTIWFKRTAWQVACVALIVGMSGFFQFVGLHQAFMWQSPFYSQWLEASLWRQLVGMGPDQVSNLFYWREQVIWHPEMFLQLAGGWGRYLLETGVVGVIVLLYLGLRWAKAYPALLPIILAGAVQLAFLQWLDIPWCYQIFLFLVGCMVGGEPERARTEKIENISVCFLCSAAILWSCVLLFPVSLSLALPIAVLLTLAQDAPWSKGEKRLAVAWGALIAVNIAFSHSSLVSLKMWYVYLTYPLLFAAGAVFAAVRRRNQSLLKLIPCLLLFAALHAGWQFVSGDAFSFEGLPGASTRVQGHTSNPILFAAYILLLLIILIASPQYWTVGQWIGLAAGEVALALSGTRGGWLAWIGVLCIGAVLSRRAPFIGYKRLLAAGIVFFFLLSGLSYDSGRSGGLDRLATVTDTQRDNSNIERINMWSAALDMGLRQPFTGVGLYQFADVYFAEYRPQMDRERVGWQNPHSDYAGWLAETGFPGLTLYFISLGFFVQKFKRRITMENKGQASFAALTLLALGGLMAFGLSYSVFTIAPVMRLGLFVIGFVWVCLSSTLGR